MSIRRSRSIPGPLCSISYSSCCRRCGSISCCRSSPARWRRSSPSPSPRSCCISPVSPSVVDRLLSMGGAELSEMRRVCVMFVDIRGFTAAARERSPADVVTRLDDAFAILVEIVDRHHGVVNKFLGDGFLAMFGAPIDDPAAAVNAIAAGRAMLHAMADANRGHAWPIRIGIGIHIGEAVTGTVGSPRRKEYTVIGDTVNLASRLESLNKEVGSQFLVSDAVHD